MTSLAQPPNLPGYADYLSLGCTEDDDSVRIVAQGRPLAVMADRAFAERVAQGRKQRLA